MKYDLCHASKDFIRESGVLIDSLIYSETKALKDAENSSVFESFCSFALPLLKTGEEISESLLYLSSYEPLIEIAEMAICELCSARKGLTQGKKSDDFKCTQKDKYFFSENAEKIMKRLFDDLVSSDISERLCCDYIRYMICILEGTVRLCEAASVCEKNENILATEAASRNLMHRMRGLLSLIK